MREHVETYNALTSNLNTVRVDVDRQGLIYRAVVTTKSGKKFDAESEFRAFAESDAMNRAESAGY